jgi:hypothetical protein
MQKSILYTESIEIDSIADYALILNYDKARLHSVPSYPRFI